MNFGRQHGLDARQSGIEFSLTDPRLVDDAWATQRTFHDERGQKGESLGHCSRRVLAGAADRGGAKTSR